MNLRLLYPYDTRSKKMQKQSNDSIDKLAKANYLVTAMLDHYKNPIK
jgi:hypothetical protein